MPLPQVNPDRLELRFGGGIVSLFGLPFLLAGLGVIAGSFAVHFGAIEGDVSLLFGIPFGAVFFLVGYCLVFGRSGIRADRESGELVKWWGLPRPMRSSSYAIARARVVQLSREIRRSDKSTYVVYPVRIAFEGEEDLKVTEARQEIRARQTAEQVAKFLAVPLADKTSGDEVVRAPDELDLSVKQRFQQGRLDAVVPDVPPQLKSRIDFDGTTLSVAIPPAGFQPGHVIGLVALLGFMAFVVTIFLVPMLSSGATQGGAGWLLVLFFGLFLAVPLSLAARLLAAMFFIRETLTATSERVEYRRGWLLKRHIVLPADEIEEIELGVDSAHPSRGSRSRSSILVRADRQSVRFGRHLAEEEKAYLLALLRAVLVS